MNIKFAVFIEFLTKSNTCYSKFTDHITSSNEDYN